MQASRGGCAIMASGYKGTPRNCEGHVTHAGLRWFPSNRTLWLVFACAAHADQLEAARPLLDRDRAELARRRERTRRQLAGQPTHWEPQPLATGAAGLRLLERARTWAATHPQEEPHNTPDQGM